MVIDHISLFSKTGSHSIIPPVSRAATATVKPTQGEPQTFCCGFRLSWSPSWRNKPRCVRRESSLVRASVLSYRTRRVIESRMKLQTTPSGNYPMSICKYEGLLCLGVCNGLLSQHVWIDYRTQGSTGRVHQTLGSHSLCDDLSCGYFFRQMRKYVWCLSLSLCLIMFVLKVA